MSDLDKAIAAAREALEGTHAENDYRHYGWAEFRALLAALDAARGQAVAWRSKSYNPALNGGFAWAFTTDADSVTNEHQPLFAAPPAECSGSRCRQSLRIRAARQRNATRRGEAPRGCYCSRLHSLRALGLRGGKHGAVDGFVGVLASQPIRLRAAGDDSWN